MDLAAMADHDNFVKAFYYVFGYNDASNGRVIDSTAFAHAWVAYCQSNSSRINIRAAFEQFREHKRIIGFDAL